MPGVTGYVAGDISRIYWSKTPITSKTLTNIKAAAVTANRILGVTTIGNLDKERNRIEFAIAGEEYSSSIPGQANPGSYDFSVALLLDNSLHTDLRADAGTSLYTFIVAFHQSSTNITYFAFDGRIGTAPIETAVGEVVGLSVSIFRQGGETRVDES